MSEYLVLNPGPDYAPEEPVPWSYNSRYSLRSQPPSYSQAQSSVIDYGRRIRTRKLPARPTYVLGIEPTKQVLLVPTFEEKDFRREDVSFNVIGPNERCWDLIRSFRVTAISGELREELYGGGISVADMGVQSVLYADSQAAQGVALERPGGTINGSDYDEFVARSLAWAEENGGTEYDHLVAQSLAWEEENRGLFEGGHNEFEAPLEGTTSDRHASRDDDGFPNLLSTSNASRHIEPVGHVGESVGHVGERTQGQQDAESSASEDDLYYDGESFVLGSEEANSSEGNRHASANHESADTAPLVPEESPQRTTSTDEIQECDGQNDVDENSDGYSEIVFVGSGGDSRQRDDYKDLEGEAFELIEWNEVQDN